MFLADLTCSLKSLPTHDHDHLNTTDQLFKGRKRESLVGTRKQLSKFRVSAAKSGGFSLNSVFKRCETCAGQGAIECSGCKGTGKNKKNGNIFERWKCFECQGFGLKGCPECGKGGLTPEQRGER